MSDAAAETVPPADGPPAPGHDAGLDPGPGEPFDGSDQPGGSAAPGPDRPGGPAALGPGQPATEALPVRGYGSGAGYAADPGSADPGSADPGSAGSDSDAGPDAGPSLRERFGDAATVYGGRAGDAVGRASAATGRIATQAVDRLRNNAELAAERGTTTIADDVVQKVAGIATREVAGVYDLGGDVARVFAAVKERIGLGEADDANKGVKVRLDGRSAAIDITVVIEYGYVIHSVTEKVRANVIAAVENYHGLEVTGVDIVVDDVHVVEDGQAAAR